MTFLQHPKRGFTLIELAVVIMIMAVLAAVAIPRFIRSTGSAECSLIKDMAPQLTNASSIWTSENAAIPTSFTQFVTAEALPNPVPPGGPTLSLETFGPRSATNPCTVGANQIICSGTFQSYTPTYTFAQGAATLQTPVSRLDPNAPVCD